MGGFATTWPCVQQRRIRRDWKSGWAARESVASEPKQAHYDPRPFHRRNYSEEIVGRKRVEGQKELLSSIARILANEDHAIAIAVERITTAQEFRRLATRWRNDTAHVSSIPDLVMDPSYQEIMRLPKNEVLPLILRELRDRGGFWYPALHALTDENPVNLQDMGNVRKMTDAWLNWGRSEGWLLGA
jgi:hypothetical protein